MILDKPHRGEIHPHTEEKIRNGLSRLPQEHPEFPSLGELLDCAPTHATICSGAGLSETIEGAGLKGAPTDDVDGGGHAAAGVCA
jgi:hypothetical protein